MVKKILLFLSSCLFLSGSLFSSESVNFNKLCKKIKPVVLTIHSKSTEQKGQVLDIANELKDSDKEKLNELAKKALNANMLFEANLDDTKKAVEAILQGKAPSKNCTASEEFKKYEKEVQDYILKGNNIAHFVADFLNKEKTIKKDKNEIVQTAICCANIYLTLNNQATYGYVLSIN